MSLPRRAQASTGTRRRSRRSVPVMFQASRTECGPACLAMVVSYHGRQMSVREARDFCGAGRDGVSAGALARAARQLGMSAAGRVASPVGLAATRLPAIAHWEDDHYVVVERAGPWRVHVVDPRFGRRRMTRPEFFAGLGQALVECRPGERFERTQIAREAFWLSYARSLLRLPGTRPLLAQVTFATVLLQALGLAIPIAIIAVGRGLGLQGRPPLLGLLGAGIALVALAQLVTTYLRSTVVLRLQGRLDAYAVVGFCSHLMRLPLRYFQQRSTGDISMRIASIASLRELLTTQTLSSVLDTGMVLSYLVILLVIDVPSGLAVAVAVAAEIALLAGSFRWIRERMAADLAAQATAQGQIVETLEGIATVKASAAEERALTQWSEMFLTWMKTTLRRGHATAVIDAAAGSLRALTPLFVLWLGANRVMHGGMSLATVLAVTWMAAAAVAPLASLLASGQQLQLAGAALQRLADVLENKPEYPQGALVSRQRPLGRIEFRDVSFSYDLDRTFALKDLSLRIEPGQKIAVVGRSGAGKSTFGLLLLGMYQPTHGQILAGGVPLAEIDPRSLRGRSGVVLQEPFVFGGTIRENITFNDSSIGADEVELAARLAELHDEVAALPMKYQTQLAARGGGLSGGQRQRLALARALVHRPDLLVLDEATSHLDAVIESRIRANLQEVGCTQVIIAHRLSTVRNADRIIVLDRGRLAEQGTHDELLVSGAQYAELIGAQLGEPATVAGNMEGR